jgi:hypothetical protein
MNDNTLYIFDLDGVLFDNSHRQHLLPVGCGSTTEQWDAFNLACEDDQPIAHMWMMLAEFLRHGHNVLFLTGRSEICERQTRIAIGKAAASVSLGCMACNKILSAQLIMRPQDDHRPASEYKRDVVQALAYAEVRRLVLVDDDSRIIDACSDYVDASIHVQPFAGCVGQAKTA